MKFLFLILFLPFLSTAQTIHFDKKEILYEGSVNAAGLTSADATGKLQTALQAAAEESNVRKLNLQSTGRAVAAQGELRLNMPYHYIRTLYFTVQLTPKEGGYDYRIDSVWMIEKRRGGSSDTLSSKKLLEGIEETGAKAIAAESLLNEIDMRFQKMLAIIERGARGSGIKQ